MDTVRTVLPLALFPQIRKVAGGRIQRTTAHKRYTDFVKLAQRLHSGAKYHIEPLITR